MVTIRLEPPGKIIRVRKGSPLKDALHEYGVEFPCGGKGTCGKCRVKLLSGEIRTDEFHRKRLQEFGLGENWRLACLSRCESDMVLEVDQYETLIQADETPFDFVPRKGLGIAVDLGTTTLVAQLLDLQNGRILAVEKSLNPQQKYGSDLVSRLDAVLSGNAPDMTCMIRKKIGEMIDLMTRGKDERIDRIVLVGNTVMQHFFCGLDIRPLSFFPFESPDLGEKKFLPGELGWKVRSGEVYFYPSIGSFVGSDILAGIMATGLHGEETYSMLIDLGTNGEIVMGNRDRLLCASTAAGPAFEGARISMGMQATTGAISSVETAAEGWKVRVIGNGRPRGICGSGLIDAVAVLLDRGVIDEYGQILTGEDQVVLADPVVVTQKDIYEFQLAKAAIATGTEILMKKLDIRPDQIGNVYIAGAFGSYINMENVTGTGMLSFRTDRVRKLGNSSLMGARMFLFPDLSLTGNILRITSHVNLESEDCFQDLFVDHMRFQVPV
ncbi:MAG: ASKHA domain-containing protein [Bacteroidales bacterium]